MFVPATLKQPLAADSHWAKAITNATSVFTSADVQPLSHRELAVLEPCYNVPSLAHTVFILVPY